MNCPQCLHFFSTTPVHLPDHEEINIYECFYCGGHFLPPLIANLIDKHQAKNIDSVIPKANIPYPTSPDCPICRQRLIAISADSVPRSIIVYACPSDHGHYFPSREFYKFKLAQEAKITYHQLWGIPIKSAFAVILPVLFFTLAVSMGPTTVNYFKARQESRVSASSPVSHPLIIVQDNNQIIISFTTKTPTTSHILLSSPNQGTSNITVSSTPRTSHVITTETLMTKTQYQFTISTPDFTSETYTFLTN